MTIKLKPNESGIEYSPPSGIGFGFDAYHLPLSHQPDGFQLLIDSESSKHFINPKLICKVESRMLDYVEINSPMEIRAADDNNTLYGIARGILLVLGRDTQNVCRNVKLPMVLVAG